ncbi:clustered mitochondria protein-like [Syzygium oleosum]|uniref:clustered mitochondria protein-like n=1 Tax=Syzygium oleosum TaxID=219896 RepID=UPI0024B925FE|nr:clustered mitochondria protein-like [Syzygium oleosum]
MALATRNKGVEGKMLSASSAWKELRNKSVKHRLLSVASGLPGDRAGVARFQDGSYNCRHVLKDHTAEVLESAKRLHLKEHAVCDDSGNIFKLAAPVECKGIVGSNDRHYLLDLMRVTPRVANYTGLGSRFCILRQELVTAFCQAQDAGRSKQSSSSNTVRDSPTDSLRVARDNGLGNADAGVGGFSDSKVVTLSFPFNWYWAIIV